MATLQQASLVPDQAMGRAANGSCCPCGNAVASEHGVHTLLLVYGTRVLPFYWGLEDLEGDLLLAF